MLLVPRQSDPINGNIIRVKVYDGLPLKSPRFCTNECIHCMSNVYIRYNTFQVYTNPVTRKTTQSK